MKDKGTALAHVSPDLAREWHPTRNNKKPQEVYAGGTTKYWWKCSNGPDHEWEARIYDRIRGRGCPFCLGRRVSVTNNLAYVSPDLAEEWHSTRNAKKPNEVYAGGKKKYWWKCSKWKDHEWEASISKRLAGRGCPVCRGFKVVPSNSLKFLLPEVAAQWHSTKNESLTSSDVTVSSHKKVWWRCESGHEWQSRVADRTRGKGCPICSGKKVDKANCLATTNPELAKQWHPTLNLNLTPYDVTSGSGRKVWWRCDKGEDHEWKTRVSLRNRGSGCPFCRGLRVAIADCLATTHPMIAKEWHPTKNPNATPYTVTSRSQLKVWWRCREGHEWETRCCTRTGNKRNKHEKIF